MQRGNFIIFLLLWINSIPKLKHGYSPVISMAKKNIFHILV